MVLQKPHNGPMSRSSHIRLDKLLAMPGSAGALLLAAVGALGFALISQFGFGHDPCVLCLWQRVPYGVVIVLAVLALVIRPYGLITKWLLALCALALLVGTGLAVFHTGVEQHWWLGTSGCTIQPLDGSPIQSLREKLLSTGVAHCDQISWTFLGFSMANWNIPVSLVLTLFAAFVAWQVEIPRRRR